LAGPPPNPKTPNTGSGGKVPFQKIERAIFPQPSIDPRGTRVFFKCRKNPRGGGANTTAPPKNAWKKKPGPIVQRSPVGGGEIVLLVGVFNANTKKKNFPPWTDV